MPVNVSPEYAQAEKKFLEAQNDEDKIKTHYNRDPDEDGEWVDLSIMQDDDKNFEFQTFQQQQDSIKVIL